MIFSFFVAVIIAPWLMIRFARAALAHGHEESGGKLGSLYKRYASKIIATQQSARRFLIIVGVATLVACSMFYFKAVTVKLLPFDNKSEVQLVADMPEGTSLEATARVLEQAAAVARSIPEVVSMEAYVGTSAPFNFNGLVRHYFLRNRPEMGDVMVTLLPKDERDRASHSIALDLREQALHQRHGAGGVERAARGAHRHHGAGNRGREPGAGLRVDTIAAMGLDDLDTALPELIADQRTHRAARSDDDDLHGPAFGMI